MGPPSDVCLRAVVRPGFGYRVQDPSLARCRADREAGGEAPEVQHPGEWWPRALGPGGDLPGAQGCPASGASRAAASLSFLAATHELCRVGILFHLLLVSNGRKCLMRETQLQLNDSGQKSKVPQGESLVGLQVKYRTPG